MFRLLILSVLVLAATVGVLGGFGSMDHRAAPEPLSGAPACTGSVRGRLVLGYGDRGPAAGEWVQIAGMLGDPLGRRKLLRTGPDGAFQVNGVPLGHHEGVARHARFAFEIATCGQQVDLGEVAYPLVRPAHSKTGPDR